MSNEGTIKASGPVGAASDPFWLERSANSKRTHFGRWPNALERSRERLVLDWYGSDYAGHEIVAHQSPAVPVGAVVNSVMARLSAQRQVTLGMLQGQWTRIVGDAIAAQSRPVMLRRKTLSVEVRSATWMHILEREHKARILTKVQEVCQEPIETIRFVPEGRHSGRQQR